MIKNVYINPSTVCSLTQFYLHKNKKRLTFKKLGGLRRKGPGNENNAYNTDCRTNYVIANYIIYGQQPNLSIYQIKYFIGTVNGM